MQAYSGTALQGAPSYIDPSVKTGWRSVNGDFGVDSFGPSKKLYTRSVSVPTNLDFVAVSHRKYRGSTFVAGLRFMADDGHSTSLGYVLDRPHLSDFRIGPRGKGAPLEGFDLAIEPRGIQNIARAFSNRLSERMAESKACVPRARLLSEDGHISTLRGTFDVGQRFFSYY